MAANRRSKRAAGRKQEPAPRRKHQHNAARQNFAHLAKTVLTLALDPRYAAPQSNRCGNHTDIHWAGQNRPQRRNGGNLLPQACEQCWGQRLARHCST